MLTLKHPIIAQHAAADLEGSPTRPFHGPKAKETFVISCRLTHRSRHMYNMSSAISTLLLDDISMLIFSSSRIYRNCRAVVHLIPIGFYAAAWSLGPDLPQKGTHAATPQPVGGGIRLSMST